MEVNGLGVWGEKQLLIYNEFYLTNEKSNNNFYNENNSHYHLHVSGLGYCLKIMIQVEGNKIFCHLFYYSAHYFLYPFSKYAMKRHIHMSLPIW